MPRSDDADALWEQRFSELERYLRLFGHVRISRSDTIHHKLRQWLRYQQQMAVAGTLPMGRWWRFQQLGVSLLGIEERWHLRLAELRAFHERFGHCRVPAKWKENIPLAHWVDVQRQFKKKGRLSAERIRLLESIGFEWHARHAGLSVEEHWERMLAHLTRFAQEHGHTEVPKNHPPAPALWEWVMNQRENRRTGVLREDRRGKLEAIGFAWEDTGRHKQERWDLRFAQMLEFRARFGHCRVPAKWKENIPLSHWVGVQRDLRKKRRLSNERIARLDAVGFEWEARGGGNDAQRDRWARMLGHLLAYREAHGDMQVPHGAGPDGLGRWVCQIRHDARHGLMSKVRREQLEAIGFEWENRRDRAAARWAERIAQLLAFRARHGHGSVPLPCPEDIALGIWASEQRRRKRRGILAPERIRQLEEAGFAWNLQRKAGAATDSEGREAPAG